MKVEGDIRSKEDLRKENEELKQALAQERSDNAQLRADIAELRTETELLRECLRQNSQNSSRPPSTDQPRSGPKHNTGERTGRKPGGQPGHVGKSRPLVPIEGLTAPPVDVRPTACRICHHKLTGSDPSPRRHQVWDIPVIKATINEWRLHSLICPQCQERTEAKLPLGVPSSHFAPRLVAGVALLSGAYRLSKRLVVAILSDFFGIDMAVGSVISCEKLASNAVEAPVNEASTYVKNQGVKHADETSWFEGPSRTKVWLWVATTSLVSVFLIRASRGAKVAREILGNLFGVLVTDRGSAYSWWPIRWRQFCWSHLKRDFTSMAEAGGRAGRIGNALLKEERSLFELWHHVRDGTLQRSTFRRYVTPIRQRVKALLLQGRTSPHSKTRGTCRELLKSEAALWTFVRVEGVEPTNNGSERAVRPAVIWRKLSFGTHSEAGSRFVERILSVVYTLKQQNRNSLEFITGCVKAALGEGRPGSLLPVRI